ncbi:MAG TPA: hypothetical protein VIZ17_11260 [Acetobacteraceae bacterium]
MQDEVVLHRPVNSLPITAASRATWRLPLGIAVGLTGVKVLIYALLARGGLATALCQWDCGWYISIAGGGYDSTSHLVGHYPQANWAFFPLYPLLLHCFDGLTTIAPRASGLVISTACFIAFAVVGSRYRAMTRSPESVWTWLLLLTMWPYGFYFHAVYTEALYAALAILGLLALEAGQPFAAGCASALLTATRPTGIVFAAWIAGDRLVRATLAGSVWRAGVALLPALIAPAGLLAFMLLLYMKAGDPLAFVHIEAGWQHTARDPAAVLWSGFTTFSFRPLRIGQPYLAAWAVLGLAAGGWLLVARRFAEAWLCGMTVIMALASGTLWSMPRFVAANPAFLLACADLLVAIRWRMLRGAVLVVMAGLQIVFVMAWYRGAGFLT